MEELYHSEIKSFPCVMQRWMGRKEVAGYESVSGIYAISAMRRWRNIPGIYTAFSGIYRLFPPKRSARIVPQTATTITAAKIATIAVRLLLDLDGAGVGARRTLIVAF